MLVPNEDSDIIRCNKQYEEEQKDNKHQKIGSEIKLAQGCRNALSGGSTVTLSKFSDEKGEKDCKSSNKSEKKKISAASIRNAPPELIHYLKDRHGPKMKNDSSPPQLLPEVIVTRTKLNKERSVLSEPLLCNRKKWENLKSLTELVETEGKALQGNVKNSQKVKKKSRSKSLSVSISSDECSREETHKQSDEISQETLTVAEIKKKFLLELQESQKKTRTCDQQESQKKTRTCDQQENQKKTSNKLTRSPSSVSSIQNPSADVKASVTSDSEMGRVYKSDNEENFKADVSQYDEQLNDGENISLMAEEQCESELSSDFHDMNSVVDYEQWITEEEVEDVDDEEFIVPEQVSTGKEERDTIDGIEFLSFETEHDMVEFTKIELDFKGVSMLDDGMVQSDDGLDMMDDSFTLSETDVHNMSQAIVPTKTKDITKIKGWRTKQFAVNNNPVHAQCSSSNGPYDDDDGFGSCDVRLEEELSFDVNEDNIDKWYGEEQELNSSKETVEDANNFLKETYEYLVIEDGQENVPPMEEDVRNSPRPASQPEAEECLEISPKQNEESHANEHTSEKRVTNDYKINEDMNIAAHLSVPLHILQSRGRKPKTLAEKRMMLEYEKRKKELRRQQKLKNTKHKRPRGRPRKHTNIDSKSRNINNSIKEHKRHSVDEYHRTFNEALAINDDHNSPEHLILEQNVELKQELNIDGSEDIALEFSNLDTPDKSVDKSSFVLDDNYKYIWDQGRPIRIAGSRKDKEPSSNKFLASEDEHTVDVGSSITITNVVSLDQNAIHNMKLESELTIAVHNPQTICAPEENSIKSDAQDSDCFEYGLVLCPAVGKPLVPLAISQLSLLRGNSQSIDEKWAQFSASVVVSRDWRKNPLPRNKIVLPMQVFNFSDPVKDNISSSKVSDHSVSIPLRHHASIPAAPTGLRLLQPAHPSVSNSNVLAPRLGPMGGSSVRMRYPKPPSQIGIRTIPGSVRLNPIISEVKSINLDTSLPCSSNSRMAATNQFLTPDSQSPCTVPSKVRTTYWKSKGNHCNEIDSDSEVRNVVSDLIDYVALREIADTFICEDPDVSDLLPTDAHVSSQKDSKKKKAMFRELSKLDVTVIDMDMHGTVEEDIDDKDRAICSQDYCKLGCICGSLQACKSLVTEHCGQTDCMFGCQCDLKTETAKPEQKQCIISEETIMSLQNKTGKFLAKEEKEFRQTVIRAKDEMIVVGGVGTGRRKREIKLPGRYRDSYMILGSGLSEPKSSNEDNTDSTRRSSRVSSMLEHNAASNHSATKNSNKKTLEKKSTPALKEHGPIKECQVTLEKLQIEGVLPYCMDHDAYECQCGKNVENVLKVGENSRKSHSSKPGILYVPPSSSREKPKILQFTNKELNELKSKLDTISVSSSRYQETNKASFLLKQTCVKLESPSSTSQESKKTLSCIQSKPSSSLHGTQKTVPNRSKPFILQRSSYSLPTIHNGPVLVKLTPRVLNSTKDLSPVEKSHDLPLVKQHTKRSRNVAVKSTAFVSYGHAHDVSRHSARTAVPGINYHIRNKSHCFIHKQNKRISELETLQGLQPENQVDLSSYLCPSFVMSQPSEISIQQMNSDIVNSLSPDTATSLTSKECGTADESTGIIGKIESVMTLSEEEFQRVKSTIDAEEEDDGPKVKVSSTKNSTKQFVRLSSGMLQFVGSVNVKGSITNLSVKELEALLNKTKRLQCQEEKMSPNGEESVHLLHFSILMELFRNNSIQLWFSKECGSVSKLLMTNSGIRPDQSFINLNEIKISQHEHLPTLILDILKHAKLSPDVDIDQCDTYVLLRFDGKSVELGETTDKSKSSREQLLSSCTSVPEQSEDLVFSNPVSLTSSANNHFINLLSSGSQKVPKTDHDIVLNKLKLQESLDEQKCSLECSNEHLNIKKRTSPPNNEVSEDFICDASTEKKVVPLIDENCISLPDEVHIDIISPETEQKPAFSIMDLVSSVTKDSLHPVDSIPTTEQQPSLLPDPDMTIVKSESSETLHLSVVKLDQLIESSNTHSSELISQKKDQVVLPTLQPNSESSNAKDSCIGENNESVPSTDEKQININGSEKERSTFTDSVTVMEAIPNTTQVRVSEPEISDATVQIPLPTCSKACRWYVLQMSKKFDFIFITSRKCSVKYNQMLEAINISSEQKGTVCLPFMKPYDSISRRNVEINKPKFGIYAVSGCLTRVFIGPYGLNETAGIIFYKIVNGEFVDVSNTGDSVTECSESNLLLKKLEDGDSHEIHGEVQSNNEQRLAQNKGVWLYPPIEKYLLQDNGTPTKLKLNVEVIQNEDKKNDGENTIEPKTSEYSTDETKECSRHKQSLDLRNCNPCDKLNNCDSNQISNTHSVVKVEEESFSDNEELDVVTVHDDLAVVGYKEIKLDHLKKENIKREPPGENRHHLTMSEATGSNDQSPTMFAAPPIEITKEMSAHKTPNVSTKVNVDANSNAQSTDNKSRKWVQPNLRIRKLRPILPAPVLPVAQNKIEGTVAQQKHIVMSTPMPAAVSTKTLCVKLVPSMPKVGYIDASYSGSGVISFIHPFTLTRMSFKSLATVNQWLHRFLQSRIRYIPRELRITWKLVSATQKLTDMEHFKSRILNGNYILTMKGIFNLMDITTSESTRFGLRQSDVLHLQNKRKRRDLHEGFNKVQKLLMKNEELEIKSKLDVITKATEEILKLQNLNSSISQEVKELYYKRSQFCQTLGNAMRDADSIEEKKRIVSEMKAILIEKRGAPIVDLGDDIESNSSSNDMSAPSSVIDVAICESDIEGYLSDEYEEDLEQHMDLNSEVNESERKDDVQCSKQLTGKCDDTSVSISLVKAEPSSDNENKTLETNDEVTVTCIPAAVSSSDTLKTESDNMLQRNSANSTKNVFNNSVESNTDVWNRTGVNPSSVQKDLVVSAVVEKSTNSSSCNALKRKASMSMDDDVVIVQSSNDKKARTDDGVDGKKSLLCHESVDNPKTGNSMIWPSKICKSILVENNTVNSNSTLPNKECLNIELCKLSTQMNKVRNKSYPYPRAFALSDLPKTVTNIKIVSNKIEPNSVDMSGDLRVSTMSMSALKKSLPNAVLMKVVAPSLLPSQVVKVVSSSSSPVIATTAYQSPAVKFISSPAHQQSMKVISSSAPQISPVKFVTSSTLQNSPMKVVTSTVHHYPTTNTVSSSVYQSQIQIKDTQSSDLGLNLINLSKSGITTPYKLSYPHKFKNVKSNILTKSKTALKYVYGRNGEKLYVKGPTGPVPVVVATRATQEESKRSVEFTIAKSTSGLTTAGYIKVPSAFMKAANQETSTTTTISDVQINQQNKSITKLSIANIENQHQGPAVQSGTKTASPTIVPTLNPVVDGVETKSVVSEKNDTTTTSNSSISVPSQSDSSNGNILVEQMKLDDATLVTDRDQSSSS